jgi:hypothetical protein
VATRTLIDDDIVEFMRGSVVSFLGTTDDRGTPDVTRATGIASAGAGRLRLLISAVAPVAWSNLARGGRVSVLVTDITNYRSIQWRGRAIEAGDQVTPGDLALADHATSAFADACPLVGVDPTMAWRLWPVEFRPVVVDVDEMFDQTPGPAAGLAMVARRGAS